MLKKIHLFRKIFQKRYIELPILELLLIGGPHQNHLFFQSVAYKGRCLYPPVYWLKKNANTKNFHQDIEIQYTNVNKNTKSNPIITKFYGNISKILAGL